MAQECKKSTSGWRTSIKKSLLKLCNSEEIPGPRLLMTALWLCLPCIRIQILHTDLRTVSKELVEGIFYKISVFSRWWSLY